MVHVSDEKRDGIASPLKIFSRAHPKLVASIPFHTVRNELSFRKYETVYYFNAMKKYERDTYFHISDFINEFCYSFFKNLVIIQNRGISPLFLVCMYGLKRKLALTLQCNQALSHETNVEKVFLLSNTFYSAFFLYFFSKCVPFVLVIMNKLNFRRQMTG